MTAHTSTPSVDVAWEPGDELGEGATWDAAHQRLISVDIMRGRVHLFDPASRQTRTFEVGQPVGAAVPFERDALMLALRDGFARLDLTSGDVTFVAHVELDKPGQRMNDGLCDAAGRFWAGTMCMQERQGIGTLYRMDRDGSVHAMLPGVTISNGIDWSLDGTRMYYVDSRTQRVDCFDFDPESGTIANRQPFVTIDPADGCPDGLTVDTEGAIWLALWDGYAIRRYLPDGTLDRIIPLPVKRPTTCAFGGPDLTDLYITTAVIGIPDAELRRQPLAGSILRVRPGVKGRPANAYAG